MINPLILRLSANSLDWSGGKSDHLIGEYAFADAIGPGRMRFCQINYWPVARISAVQTEGAEFVTPVRQQRCFLVWEKLSAVHTHASGLYSADGQSRQLRLSLVNTRPFVNPDAEIPLRGNEFVSVKPSEAIPPPAVIGAFNPSCQAFSLAKPPESLTPLAANWGLEGKTMSPPERVAAEAKEE